MKVVKRTIYFPKWVFVDVSKPSFKRQQLSSETEKSAYREVYDLIQLK